MKEKTSFEMDFKKEPTIELGLIKFPCTTSIKNCGKRRYKKKYNSLIKNGINTFFPI